MEIQCHNCQHKRNVPGDSHIACVKPDPDMTWSEWGFIRGWCFYPLLFDPMWLTKECVNFTPLNRDAGTGLTSSANPA